MTQTMVEPERDGGGDLVSTLKGAMEAMYFTASAFKPAGSERHQQWIARGDAIAEAIDRLRSRPSEEETLPQEVEEFLGDLAIQPSNSYARLLLDKYSLRTKEGDDGSR